MIGLELMLICEFMKRLIKLLFLCSLLLFSVLYPNNIPTEKKKILILSSNGGYGHGAAAKTLQVILGGNYEIKIVYPIQELKMWGVDGGESFYNNIIQRGWTRSMNAITRHVAPKLFRNRKRNIERLIDRHLVSEKPDLVISLIPFINYPATEAARKKDIPYLLVTTDNDLRNWVHGLQSVTHPNFKVTIGTDLPSTTGLLEKRHISKEAINVIGLPIRTSFKISENIQHLQQDYGIPHNKSVILIMMGGAGGEKCLEYTRALGSLPLGIHLIVCTGKNENLAKKIKEIELHSSNSITVMGFTNNMADLMTLSHLMITKPGPGAINEAIAMRLPVLIDKTSSPLSWERANIALVTKYEIGEPITRMEDLPQLVNKYLFNTTFRENLEHAFNSIPSNEFNEKVGYLVDAMCSNKY